MVRALVDETGFDNPVFGDHEYWKGGVPHCALVPIAVPDVSRQTHKSLSGPAFASGTDRN
jgi:hypothetical protein